MKAKCKKQNLFGAPSPHKRRCDTYLSRRRFLHVHIALVYAFVVFLVCFYIYVYLVEEKELIQRLGESYMGYRKKVPTFFVKPKDL